MLTGGPSDFQLRTTTKSQNILNQNKGKICYNRNYLIINLKLLTKL